MTRWGNLTAISPYNGKPSESLSSSAGTNNQLSGFGYDAAGNMTGNGSISYVYDAENRLVWTSGYRYIYDGNGQRVEKCQAASATTACPTSGTTGTLYWRGTGSDTLAETDLAGNDQEEYIFFNGQRIARRDTTSTGTTIAIHYYFSDHLGTHGVVENATGTTCEQDIDYYPYGGAENDYCSGSGVAQNYKFTGKERDTESGLDYFGARHHASTMGRFTSPDPKMPRMRQLLNPQKWNKYAYTINNPLRYFDPDGMEEMVLQLRTFIQQQSVSDPFGRHFAGDKRGFTTSQDVTSRTSISVRIEPDPSKRPGNPIISVTPGSSSETRQVDANGNTIRAGTAQTGLPTVTGTRDADGNAVLNFTQDTKNPLENQTLTPGIRADIYTTVGQNGSWVATNGMVSATPSVELNVEDNTGNATNIPLQTEPSGSGFGAGLFLPLGVENFTPLPPPPPPPPQCATDKEKPCQ